MSYVFGSPEMVCRYDHEHGPCRECGADAPVGWAHLCLPCWEKATSATGAVTGEQAQP